MRIINLKKLFISELSGIYPIQEIENFFYLLSKNYLNITRVTIALEPSREVLFEIEQKYYSAIAALKKEVPIQYILGKTEFYGLTFMVDKNVLIPRPETEELVRWVIDDHKKTNEKINLSEKPILKILDIGTGSGCIAISLAKNITNAKVWALDVSKKALKIARQNAILNTVDIQYLSDNILNISSLSENLDIIISNPPYVRELEKGEINNNVLQYEPHLALFVKDNDPLLFYDRIAELAKKNLNDNGLLYFEINQYLGNETVDLLIKKGYKNIELKKDIFGVDRMIKAMLDH